MSLRQAILNTSGFFSITSLWQSGPWAGKGLATRGWQGEVTVLQGLTQWTPERGLMPAQPGLGWAGSGPVQPPAGLWAHIPWGGYLCGVVTCAGRLPVQGGEEAAGRQQDGALGEATAPLVHPLQVPLGEVSHADGPCRAVQELVPISGGRDKGVAQSRQRPAIPISPSGLRPAQPNPGASARRGLRRRAEPGLRGRRSVHRVLRPR